jgi:hypothetical protein
MSQTPLDPYTFMEKNILPILVEHFKAKSSDYGPDGFTDLGLRGQFSDIWRKVKKLKRTIWDGETLQFEDTEEILKDLFGHILISLYLIQKRDIDGTPDNALEPTRWDDLGRCPARNVHGRRCRSQLHSPELEHIF